MARLTDIDAVRHAAKLGRRATYQSDNGFVRGVLTDISRYYSHGRTVYCVEHVSDREPVAAAYFEESAIREATLTPSRIAISVDV